MYTSGYTFILTSWKQDSEQIASVRNQVLVHELGIERNQLDMHEDDAGYHVLVFDGGGRAIGVARLLESGRIDYIAVLRPWRGKTVGKALLLYLNHIAYVKKLRQIWIEEPIHSADFFIKNRFIPFNNSDYSHNSSGLVKDVMRPGFVPTAYH